MSERPTRPIPFRQYGVEIYETAYTAEYMDALEAENTRATKAAGRWYRLARRVTKENTRLRELLEGLYTVIRAGVDSGLPIEHLMLTTEYIAAGIAIKAGGE